MCTAQRIKEEIEILRRAGKHKFVVQLIDAYETETHVELVMELMQGGELYGRIANKGPYKEVQAALIMRRITSAVAFLHAQGIVHRDLKPENLLLLSKEHEEAVKLADFGLARLLEDPVKAPHMTTVCGTWAYSAPEVRIFRRKYTNKVDIWSMGVILFTVRDVLFGGLQSCVHSPPPLLPPFADAGRVPSIRPVRHLQRTRNGKQRQGAEV